MKNKATMLSEIIKEIKSGQCKLSQVKKLVHEMEDLGIDINSKKYRGRTLLHYAVNAHEEKVVEFLIKEGLNPEICDDNYNTPLLDAIINNDLSMVKILVECGASLNTTGEFEQTPLHLGVVTNNLDIIKYLISKGADPDMVDEKNLRPIDYAIDEKNQEMINFLANKEGGINNGI